MQDLASLTEKYINKTLTKKEREQLKKLVLKNKENLSYFKKKLVNRSQNQLFHDFDSDAAFKHFEPMLEKEKSSWQKTKKWLPYAAAAVGLFAVVKMVFIPNNPTTPLAKEVGATIEGTNAEQVILTLSDGTEKVLHSNKAVTIAEENGKPIVKTSGAGLDYSPAEETQVLGHHKLYIPKGQKFNLTLSDGTKVWMNSGSTLTFPPRFDEASGTRTVYLNGEAFFDVAENRDFPFIVNINDLNIKVLGTKFNVTAYEEQHQVATALVEGSVQLYDGNSSGEITLKPNQLGAFDKFNKSLTKKAVDVGYYTAWMQNKIVFRDMPMREILNNIERTYNVNITNYNQVIATERFTGEFDVEDIETIFKTISASIQFEYEIRRNEIIIKK